MTDLYLQVKISKSSCL